MRKVLIVLGVLLVLVVAGLVAVYSSLDSIVKKAVETVGPKVAQVPVKLDRVSIKPAAGEGSLTGLEIGNPPGYKTPFALRFESIQMSLDPGSVMSDKVVIKSIRIEAPQVNFEGSLKDSNLSKIQSNLQSFSSTEAKGQGSSSSKRLQVDELVITGAKVSAATASSLVSSLSLTLPEVRLEHLGQGPEGISAADLVAKVIDALMTNTLATVGESVSKIQSDILKEATKQTGDPTGKSLKSITDLFKKKR